MFCSNCGNKLQMNDQYCETCGAKRLSTVESTKSNMKRWHWLMPMIAFLLAAICLSGYLFTEHKKTNSAMEAFKKGETAALEGEYKEARKFFKEALVLRSKFPAAKENVKLVNSAIEIKERLHIAAKHQNDQEFNKSYEQLEKAEGILSTYSGKVADSIGTDIRNTRMNVKVTEISHEMKGKSKLEELEPILVKAEKIDLKEAKEIAEEIRDRIAEIAFAQANDLLTDHQFTAALTSVKKGLYHKPKNEKLINLKSTIQNEQAAFEKAQEKRYEQALIAASKEKEHNLNDALEVISIKAKFNDLGDLIVKGSVKSKATVPITSVSISYSLIDGNKRVYDENEVYISPDVLYPDEIGTFEYTHYLIDKEFNVEYNEANWYLQ
ncbi:zinc ribbon domain-containing protein [Pseudalkalibacillus salsuginis]|uniref:zinc ribbon domain-containing protein n=1 Tax=Pseudalkalibacillus salsuginis TaxID=2910972 RepID=UPI001F37474D|nr:zinc ribbon domain-containing protein [Pseudalkalibacillus salsuginis]MCF6410833.1 zinc ribbon domain-containing protein [Pseudalkalibacillus salsuginis]